MTLLKNDWRAAGSPVRTMPAPQATLEPMQAPEQYESLQDLLSVLRRFRWTIVGTTVTLVGLTLLACLLLTPKYTSTATLEIIPDDSSVGGVGGSGGQSSAATDDVKTEVATDTSILMSNTLALRTIQKLDLLSRAPFKLAIDKTEHGRALAEAPLTRQKLLKVFSKSLKVEPVADTRLIEVSFRDRDPQVAANVANTLSETFIQDYVQRRLDTNSQFSFWLSRELDAARKRVGESEQALADFERQTGLTGIDMGSSSQGSEGATLQTHSAVIDRLNTLYQELNVAEANRISAEGVYRLLKNQSPEVVLGLGSISSVSGSSSIGQTGSLDLLRTLRSQEVGLKVQYADLQTKYGAKNPRLLELQNQITSLDQAVNRELANITERAYNAYQYAKNAEDVIQAQIVKQQGEVNKLTDNTAKLQVLAQQALSNRNQYQSLYSKLQDASVQQGIHATRISIVDRAEVKGLPSFPNYPIALAVALVLGVVFGIALAFLRQSLDHSVTLPRDVETTVHTPVLAFLPRFSDANAALAATAGGSALLSQPDSPLAEAFRVLRTALVMSSPVQPGKLLLITSPLGSDGKTTLTYNLGIALAQQGSRVLLIDGDLRHADLHHFFGADNQVGLSEALQAKQVSVADRLVHHPSVENLSLLPAGKRPELPSELFSGTTLDPLLLNLRKQFDWILIDSPPVLPVADTAVLCSKVDAILPVVRAGITSRAELQSMNQLLERAGAPVVGYVLNGVPQESTIHLHTFGYQRSSAKRRAYA